MSGNKFDRSHPECSAALVLVHSRTLASSILSIFTCPGKSVVAEKNVFLVFASFLCLEHPSLLVSLESASSPWKVQLQSSWKATPESLYDLGTQECGCISAGERYQRKWAWPKKRQSTETQMGWAMKVSFAWGTTFQIWATVSLWLGWPGARCSLCPLLWGSDSSPRLALHWVLAWLPTTHILCLRFHFGNLSL